MRRHWRLRRYRLRDRRAFRRIGRELRNMTAEARNFVLAKIPLGRAGRPDEVASMVAWLATEECSFTTGAAFDLTGGRATY